MPPSHLGLKGLTHPCSASITVVVVSTEIFLANKQIVVTVQLPELAVDDVEVLIREKVGDLIDIVLDFQPTNCLHRQISSHPSVCASISMCLSL